MAFCVHDWKDTKVQQWNRFDTYRPFPATKEDLFGWFKNFKDMKHTPFSVENFLTSLNVWFVESSEVELKPEEVVHPESFLTDLGKLQGFLEQHCYSPSLLEAGLPSFVHSGPIVIELDQLPKVFPCFDVSKRCAIFPRHGFQVYSDPYRHDDDQQFIMLIAGRLKVEPATLLVAFVHLNCWI